MLSDISLKGYISGIDEKLKADFAQKKDPISVLRKRTQFFDELIENRLAGEAWNEKIFLAAVGGYGRKELYPKSDIDIIIIHKKCDEKLLNKIYDTLIVPLIDSNIDVGYSYMYYKELPKDIEGSLTTITSLLDLRLVRGSFKLFNYFHSEVFLPFLKKNRKLYTKAKLKEYEKRLEKYNDSPYILEPNVKEGIGGLREFHYISWLSKVLLSISDVDGLFYNGYLDKNDIRKLRDAYIFLSRVRIYIHYYHYLQKEKLSFDLQDEVSLFLGYQDSSTSLRVEHFMSDYYRHTHNVFLITSKLLHNYTLTFKRDDTYIRKEIDRGIYLEGFGEGEINVMPKVIKENKRLILKCFYYAKKLRKRLSYNTINLIQRLDQQVVGWNWDEELKNIFFKIISPDDSFTKEVLKDMYNSNLFQLIFPEFKSIHHKMQFDAYHIYTIDMHTIIAMSKLTELFNKNSEDIRKKIKSPHLLSFAVFLHDIGKGAGKDHAKKGAIIAEQILKGMPLEFQERELLVFLVKNHLLLSGIAQRRDISDYNFLRKVYKDVIKNRENLYYLYFLTMVDLMAVGEGVWNTWKKKLLNNLLDNFEKIIVSQKDFAEEEIKVKKREIKKLLQEEGKSYLLPVIDVLTENYLLNNDVKDILKYLDIDYELISSDKKYVLKVIPHESERYFEVVIATKDEKGLFSQLAGAFTLVGFNILGANINTRKNSNVLDVFMVDLGKRAFEYDKSMFEKLDDYLKKIINQHEKIDKLVIEKAKKYHKKSVFKEKDEVSFDNISSEKFTIIEVYAKDHMGLLFEITKTLANINLDIHFSRISTMGDRAVDVFYVLKNNEKILNDKELEGIRQTILKNISI